MTLRFTLSLKRDQLSLGPIVGNHKKKKNKIRKTIIIGVTFGIQNRVVCVWSIVIIMNYYKRKAMLLLRTIYFYVAFFFYSLCIINTFVNIKWAFMKKRMKKLYSYILSFVLIYNSNRRKINEVYLSQMVNIILWFSTLKKTMHIKYNEWKKKKRRP